MPKRTLVWFQRELRIHDNPILECLQQQDSEAIALWFLPKKASKHQKWFLGLSALEFQRKLHELGLPLFLLKGDPLEIIPRLQQQLGVDSVLTSKPFNSRDEKLQDELEKRLQGKELLKIATSTLIHPEDLPFSINEMPRVFSHFRRLVQKKWHVRNECNSKDLKFAGISTALPKDLETFDEKDLKDIEMPFGIKPGEDAALEHLNNYMWNKQAIATYKDSRNGMIEKFDSSKISPWLSIGALSVRHVYFELIRFEEKFSKNESTDWFIQELLWRDYFKFLALSIKDRLFKVDGLKNQSKKWRQDAKLFKQWQEGWTGSPFVDANMIELAQTGWMSNRGRQNVASYFAKTLNMDWTWGASYFEDTLIDFDIESNWGNWLYLSGQGTDPRDRIFDVNKQAEYYDPEGKYQELWLSRR